MNPRFEGIFPPIVTPTDEKEKVDEQAFEVMLNHVIGQGVHGIYLLGSTGECVSLEASAYRQAIELAVSVVAGRVPIICGCMESSTKRVVARVEVAQSLGVQAVAMTPPYYYPCSGDDELLAFYREVAASTDLPVFIYNIPQMTKIMIPVPVIAELSETVPNIAGIKDSSGDWANFLWLYEAVGNSPGFSLFVGSHFLAGAAIWYGAAGAVLSISNIDPAMAVRLYQAARQGDRDEMHAIQSRILQLAKLYTYGAQASCIKTCLEIMGLCPARVTSPFQALSPAAYEELRTLLTELGLASG